MTFNVFAILMFNIVNYIIIIYLLWWLYIFVPLFFVYPFIHWWTWVHQLGCFHLLTIVHNAPMNMSAQLLSQSLCFQLFWVLPRRRIVGSYCNSIFNFLRNHYTVFHSGWTIWHSHHQCPGVPILSHLHQHLLFSVLLLSFHSGCEGKSASESWIVPLQGLLPREPWFLSHTDLSPGKSQLCSNRDPTTWESPVKTWGNFDFLVLNGYSLNRCVLRA